MLKHDPQQRSFCRHTVCLCKYLSAGRTETQCRKVNMTKRIRFYNVCQSVLILSLTYMLTFITMWCHFVSLPGAHFIDFVLFICLSVWIHRPTLSLSLSLSLFLSFWQLLYVHLHALPQTLPTDSRTIRGCHFLWYGKAILHFIFLFICPFVKETPLAVYYALLAGEKYLQKDTRRPPASCNASLVHCLSNKRINNVPS